MVYAFDTLYTNTIRKSIKPNKKDCQKLAKWWDRATPCRKKRKNQKRVLTKQNKYHKLKKP